METPDGSDVVAGIFPDEQSADAAVGAMIEDGAPRAAIGTVRVENDRTAASAVRRGAVTGAVVGAATGVVLEATALAFPHAAIFIAGGTLAAALAGLAVGSSTGAVASALVRLGLGAASAHRLGSALVGRRDHVLVTLSSPDLNFRAWARLRMRVQGAIETRDSSDDDTGPVFVRGFATVIPHLRADLRDREGTDRRWEQVEHQYRYGWQLANRPDMRERSWSDASIEVRTDWERRHPNERWRDVARFVEAGWTAARADQMTTRDRRPSSGAA